MPDVRRRSILKAGLGGLASTATVGTAAGQDDGETRPDFEGYIDKAAGGYVDARGQDEVTVTVGASGNQGNFAFEPAGLWIDTGTTVIWEWTGKGGQHNVVEEGGEFESELSGDSGFTFEHTFESGGVFQYYCAPHKSLEMKGAIGVGDDVPTVEAGAGGGGGGQQGTPYTLAGDSITKAIVGVVFGVLGLAAISLLGAEGYAEYRNRNRASATTTAGDTEAGKSPGREPGEPVTYSEEAAEPEPVNELGHDEYDPTGTATLIAIYLAILVLMWVFMYFVEFLGNGPTVIG